MFDVAYLKNGMQQRLKFRESFFNVLKNKSLVKWSKVMHFFRNVKLQRKLQFRYQKPFLIKQQIWK